MGNETDQNTGNTQAQTQNTQSSGDNNEAARIADLQSQLDRYGGDTMRFAEKMHERNYQLRQRAQEAEEKAPKENQVIISADEAKLLADYKSLGAPKELTEAQAELVKLKRYQMVSKAAGVAGMNPNVLNKLLPNEATLEIGEAKDEEGNAKREVLVNIDGETPVSVQKYAEANWADFLPALVGPDEEKSGKPWVPQIGSAQAKPQNGKSSIVQEHIERAKKQAEVPNDARIF